MRRQVLGKIEPGEYYTRRHINIFLAATQFFRNRFHAHFDFLVETKSCKL